MRKVIIKKYNNRKYGSVTIMITSIVHISYDSLQLLHMYNNEGFCDGNKVLLQVVSYVGSCPGLYK